MVLLFRVNKVSLDRVSLDRDRDFSLICYVYRCLIRILGSVLKIMEILNWRLFFCWLLMVLVDYCYKEYLDNS